MNTTLHDPLIHPPALRHRDRRFVRVARDHERCNYLMPDEESANFPIAYHGCGARALVSFRWVHDGGDGRSRFTIWMLRCEDHHGDGA